MQGFSPYPPYVVVRAFTSQVHTALASAAGNPICALLLVVRLIRINGNKTAE